MSRCAGLASAVSVTMLTLGLGLCFAAEAYAQVPGLRPESPLSFGGYVRYLTIVNFSDHGDTLVDHLIHQRFDFEYRAGDELAFNAGLRTRLFVGDSVGTPGYENSLTTDPGFLNLSWNWVDDDNTLANSTFDRLFVDWKPDAWQLRAGRQRIGWGMTTLWNPNDLFNVYTSFDVEYDERPGTDAVLLGRDLGFASRVETVWGLGDNWDETTLTVRYQGNEAGFDWQLIGGKNRVDAVAGGGLAGSFAGAGLRSEITHFEPMQDKLGEVEQKSTTVATVETDYSLSGRRNPTWRIALLYVSSPQAPAGAAQFVRGQLTAKTISFAEYTSYADLSFDITPLSRQTFGAGFYDDGSWFVTGSNRISLSDDWDLLLVWQHFNGSNDSLFGANPAHLIFAHLGWNF